MEDFKTLLGPLSIYNMNSLWTNTLIVFKTMALLVGICLKCLIIGYIWSVAPKDRPVNKLMLCIQVRKSSMIN